MTTCHPTTARRAVEPVPATAFRNIRRLTRVEPVSPWTRRSGFRCSVDNGRAVVPLRSALSPSRSVARAAFVDERV